MKRTGKPAEKDEPSSRQSVAKAPKEEAPLKREAPPHNMLVLEYWRAPDGQFYAQSRDHPLIAASGDSLDQLKSNIAGCIRDRMLPVPVLYDLVQRDWVGP